MPGFWHRRLTLVTGATGLLGGWLVRNLVGQGADVVCLVRDWVPDSNLLKGDLLSKVRVVRGEIQDQALIERVLGEHEIDTVFHLAAQTIVGVANRNPVSTFDSNIRGTWSMLEACRRSPLVNQIVVASSDKAYGAQAVLPYKEDTPLQGMHPYDVSKSCADLISQAYAHSYGLPVCVTRCGNLFGGGDLNYNRIVPGTIRSVLSGEAPIIRSDGQFIRDYFYVEDAALAYMRLAESIAKNSDLCGEAFNFSLGAPLSVIELVKEILLQMGSELRPEILNEASNEIRDQHLDASKAHEKLGWSPEYGLSEGMRRTIEWYREALTPGYPA